MVHRNPNDCRTPDRSRRSRLHEARLSPEPHEPPKTQTRMPRRRNSVQTTTQYHRTQNSSRRTEQPGAAICDPETSRRRPATREAGAEPAATLEKNSHLESSAVQRRDRSPALCRDSRRQAQTRHLHACKKAPSSQKENAAPHVAYQVWERANQGPSYMICVSPLKSGEFGATTVPPISRNWPSSFYHRKHPFDCRLHLLESSSIITSEVVDEPDEGVTERFTIGSCRQAF